MNDGIEMKFAIVKSPSTPLEKRTDAATRL